MDNDDDALVVTGPAPKAGTEIVPWHQATTFPAEIIDTARMVAASGYYSDIKSVAQAAFKLMVGRECGLGIVESLNYVHVIVPRVKNRDGTYSDGPPSITLGYPVLAALVDRHPNYRYTIDTPMNNTQECRISFYRREHGGERKLGVSAFSMEDAERAGLVKDFSNWVKYPARMLLARAISHGVKAFCPGVLLGAAVEEAYIEGEVRVIEDAAPEPPEAEPVPEIHAPPEGFPDPWRSFWPKCVESGFVDADGKLDKAAVHAFFTAGPEDGALLAKVEATMTSEGLSLAQVLNAMIVQMEATGEAWRTMVRPVFCGHRNDEDVCWLVVGPDGQHKGRHVTADGKWTWHNEGDPGDPEVGSEDVVELAT